MVITVKDITWDQTSDEVHVRVIFCGKLNPKKLNIFTHRDFLKLNYSPFFREIFLAHPIDEVHSRCRVLENEVRFKLKKLEAQIWETFEKNVEDVDKIQMKEDIVTDSHTRHEQRKNLMVEKGALMRRKDMEKEISRESEMRKQIEEINRDIRDKENAKIEKLREVSTLQAPRVADKSQKTAVNQVPEVRKHRNIVVDFTERRFPTPKRESQDHLEQDWIKKQYEARKVVGFVEEDLKPEERNPEWLKEKAKDFFHKGNYLGAISAYSTAIRLTPECYDLFLDRSACHMAVDNLQRCIEDCSRAYELLTPAVDANLSARVQCLARRGAAFCKIGLLKQGLAELQAALKLSTADDNLQRDVKMIEERLEDSDTD